MPLFTRLVAQSYPPSSPIAPHPRLETLRDYRKVLLPLIGVLFIGAAGVALIFGIIVSLPMFLLLFIHICNTGFSFVVERWWKSLEALRQGAVRDNQRLLAREQPEPNAEALHLPVRITLHLSKKSLLCFGLLLTLLLIGMADIIFLLILWFLHLFHYFNWLWLLILSLGLGVLILLVLISLWLQHWVVEIQEEGMRSWEHGLGMSRDGVPLLAWSEAKLFACYRKPGPWKKDSSVIYELSSARQVVLWTWSQKNKSWGLTKVPTIPFEEYQAQMRALCSLIAAKTGLPLYDLSQPVQTNEENANP